MSELVRVTPLRWAGQGRKYAWGKRGILIGFWREGQKVRGH
jgi:hypothetical protein